MVYDGRGVGPRDAGGANDRQKGVWLRGVVEVGSGEP